MRSTSNSLKGIGFGIKKYSKLLGSIVIDLIGMATYGAPGAGEIADIIWAAISFSILKAMYSENSIYSWAFWEEVLPLADIIPSGCLSWYKKYYKS